MRKTLFISPLTVVLNLLEESVTCPGGHTTRQFTALQDGSKRFPFGSVCAGCPLRQQCTTAAAGRTVRVHPQEALLQGARAHQGTAAGRAQLRERVVAEPQRARLGQLGMGQARYVGRAKTRGQRLLLATIANLRWTWNWLQAQALTRGGTLQEQWAAAA